MQYIVRERLFDNIVTIWRDDRTEIENIIVIFTRKLRVATHGGQDRILLVRTIRLHVVLGGKNHNNILTEVPFSFAYLSYAYTL